MYLRLKRILSMKTTIKTKIDKNGRISIPSSFRKALGLKSQDEIIAVLKDGSLNITTLEHSLHVLQSQVQSASKEKEGSMHLVKELLEERRREVAHEQ